MDIFKPLLKMIWKLTEKNDNRRIFAQKSPDGVVNITDIPYINDLNKYHLLDIHYPENTKKRLPLIIDIHGGGWWYGTKEINRHYSMELAKRGFAVADINYRLVDRVTIIDQLADIFDCLKWLDDNSDSYPIDRNNVFITGDSAGGQLCCLTAQINADSELRKRLFLTENKFVFKAACATSPAIDLISPNIMMNVNLTSLLGTANHKSSPYYSLMRFENVATSVLPPFYIVTSSGDFIRKQSYKLRNILNALGVETQFHDYGEKYNGRYLNHVFSVLEPHIPPAQRNIDAVAAFFKSYI